MIIYRDQKQFNVTIMKFKNFSVYVQKRIDLMLKKFREFVKIYIDNIIIFFKVFKNHIQHLNKTFQKLSKFNVILNPKIFLNYFSIVLLKQIINVFDIIIAKEKLTIISILIFFKTLKKLKIYFALID